MNIKELTFEFTSNNFVKDVSRQQLVDFSFEGGKLN